MFYKTLIVGLLVLAQAALFTVACAEGNGARDTSSTETEAQPAESPNTSSVLDDEEVEGSLAANVESERAKEERQGNEATTEEAVAAVEETRTAIAAIEREDRAEAIGALERAIGKLEVLLARKPEMSFIALDASTRVVNPVVDVVAVDGLRESVEELVDNGDFQSARFALEAMASEIRVTTVNLPLATYPSAIREAARALEEGDPAEAKAILQSALSTLYVVERRVPLPVVNAQHLIELASEKTVAEREQALELLTRAQEELHLAESLGYGFRERDWADLDEEIRSLKDSIESEADSGGLFDALQENLRTFRARIAGDRST